MKEFFENEIVQGVFVTIICTIIFWIVRHNKYSSDEAKLVAFLKKSKEETENTFRTTHAISSATNLSEERVRVVCSKSSKITRNQKEKESWRLSDIIN